MKLLKTLSQLAAGAALAVAACAANADTYDFVITGDYSAHFQLTSSPVPDDGEDGLGFVLWDTPGFADAAEGVVDLTFYHADIGGGLEIYDFYGDVSFMVADGPQLYTGSEAAPTFLLGTFALTEFQGTGTYSLTITNVSAVPEPESYAMLLAGIGALGFVAARRRKA